MAFDRLANLLAGLILGIWLALDPGQAYSQLRTLPANAKRAELTGYQSPFVVIGGEVRRLAPGAVIFDINNRTITPGFLPAKADVVYTIDQTGSVMRIYLLNAQEQQRLDAARR
ncbi:MAG: hypothetical protein GEV05_05165 [Betaproteobacteria bacterium]|nr:hypothetical protein [Betaproteobacteria bacterium]